MNGNNGKFRMTREEQEFAELRKHLDIEIFALELEHSTARGVREASDRRQAEFDKQMESHPKTSAERERWKRNWEEYRLRMARLKQQDEVIPAERAARQLARRWGLPAPETRRARAKLVG